ncbi:MAG: hypothetical protein L0Y36_06530 [Planctomycetales bacterium]|nr:hypothetical protein [Planctomycetales bacterium]
MTTQAQIEANRKNAHKSTGPQTPEGKFIVSQNATIHGLTADRLIIQDEDRGEFDAFYAKMFTDLAPIGALEQSLAERIIALAWRCRRAEWMESSTLNVLITDSRPKQAQDPLLDQHDLGYIGDIVALDVLGPFDDESSGVESYAEREEKVKAVSQSVARTLSEVFNENAPDRIQEDSSPRTVLGRMVIEDFGGSRVIERFLRYQGEMERRLDKAVFHIQRIQYVRKRNASIEAENQKNETKPIKANGTRASSPR